MTDQLDLDLTLPYINDLPGIGGKIRQQPSHFAVEEIPVYLQEFGDVLHLLLRLITLTSPDDIR